MQIRKKKTITPAQRIQAANERTGFALTVFEGVVGELENAAEDFFAIEEDSHAQAERLHLKAEALTAQGEASYDRGTEVSIQADNIRRLIGLVA